MAGRHASLSSRPPSAILQFNHGYVGVKKVPIYRPYNGTGKTVPFLVRFNCRSPFSNNIICARVRTLDRIHAFLQTSLHVVPLGSNVCLWWSRPLVVGHPVPYLQLKELGTSSGKESIPRTLLTPRNTCLVVSLSHSGVGMPPCGFVGFLPSHHRLMDSLKYFILFYHTFYIFALFWLMKK